MRQQIFRQTKQKFAGRVPPLSRIFVTYDGKDASRCVLKALAVNCAVLPISEVNEMLPYAQHRSDRPYADSARSGDLRRKSLPSSLT
mgnify:CR=1 FL=1